MGVGSAEHLGQVAVVPTAALRAERHQQGECLEEGEGGRWLQAEVAGPGVVRQFPQRDLSATVTRNARGISAERRGTGGTTVIRTRMTSITTLNTPICVATMNA
jgi:hypothetical protein